MPECLHDDRFTSAFGSRPGLVECSHDSLQNRFGALADVSGELDMEVVPCLFIDERVDHSFIVQSIRTR